MVSIRKIHFQQDVATSQFQRKHDVAHSEQSWGKSVRAIKCGSADCLEYKFLQLSTSCKVVAIRARISKAVKQEESWFAILYILFGLCEKKTRTSCIVKQCNGLRCVLQMCYMCYMCICLFVYYFGSCVAFLSSCIWLFVIFDGILYFLRFSLFHSSLSSSSL